MQTEVDVKYIIRLKTKTEKGYRYSTGGPGSGASLKEAARYDSIGDANFARSSLNPFWVQNARIIPVKPKAKPSPPGSFTVGVAKSNMLIADDPCFDLVINGNVVDTLHTADAASIRAKRILDALSKTLVHAIPMPHVVEEAGQYGRKLTVNGVTITEMNNAAYVIGYAAKLREALGTPPPVKAEPTVDIETIKGTHSSYRVRVNYRVVFDFIDEVAAGHLRDELRKALGLPPVTA